MQYQLPVTIILTVLMIIVTPLLDNANMTLLTAMIITNVPTIAVTLLLVVNTILFPAKITTHVPMTLVILLLVVYTPQLFVHQKINATPLNVTLLLGAYPRKFNASKIIVQLILVILQLDVSMI
jgi:hypothetical protein